MSNLNEVEKPKNSTDSTEKEEINLQFHWYLLGFISIYFLSWSLPGFLMWMYLQFIYIPYFLNAESLLIIFTTLEGLLASLCFPLVIMISYLIHLFFIGLITKFWWSISERISPVKDGIIPRNEPSKNLNLYHVRSFLIKYPKHAFNRGPFPWLINWLYNFVGTNEIGKGTVIEEQFGADKGVEIGENCYIGVNSGFSSHAVDGIFGNVAYFKIEVGDNVTTSALNCVAPGVEIHDNSYLLPMAGATKNNVLRGDNYYFGAPLRKAFSRKVKKYLDITDEDLERAERLKEKRKSGGEKND